jgi:hypothetical protein
MGGGSRRAPGKRERRRELTWESSYQETATRAEVAAVKRWRSPRRGRISMS